MPDLSTRYFIPGSILDEIKKHLNQQFERNLEIVDSKEIAGWFMGTRGENLSEVSEIITSVLASLLEGRRSLFPEDPDYITDTIKSDPGYKKGMNSVKEQTNNLLTILNNYSLPTQSLRYQGHMLWDITLPSLVGYFAAMMQNQNNVTPQASPATTILELLVANDIAQMAGFEVKPLDDNAHYSDAVHAWAHISCDGSVANIEGLWAARELKFMPLGIKYALNEDEYFKPAADSLKLHPEESGLLFKDATAWELLNLKQDHILLLPELIAKWIFGEDWQEHLSEVWQTITSKYSLNARGIQFFYSEFLEPEGIFMPAIVVPSTKHYSWPKAASILGMGNGQKGLSEKELCDIETIKNDGLINVYVDPEGKVKTDLLKNVLATCRDNKKPVVMVVGVMGTTEEGAVDPLETIIEDRNDFRKDLENPFEYSIHADAAWGGYFLTCFRNAFEMEGFPDERVPLTASGGKFDNSDTWMRDSVFKSMVKICECESVTIDPHKMGYIPYPAGSLIYRNDEIINLLTFSAPYISSGGAEGEINTRNIGECGIEGSKAGAAPASVYLSHMVIRPDKRGYGKIINQSMLNSKLFYLYLCAMKYQFPDDKFETVMFNELPSAIDPGAFYRKLWDAALNLENLTEDDLIQTALRNIAGDQNLIDYIFLDKKDTSPERTDALNNAVFNALSLTPGTTVKGDEIYVSMTTFHRKEYGNDFMDALAQRLYGIESDPYAPIQAIPCIRSVVMDPWAIYTHEREEEKRFNFFTEIFFPKLREVVNELCEKTTEELKK